MRVATAVVAALAIGASGARGQTIPGAVLAKQEPHHHLAYEDSVLRVLRVLVPAHDTTLLHEHGPDYFWIALGASDVVNVRLGAAPATIHSEDRSVHYTVGRFAHVARNPGDAPFRNITVELLRGQSNPRNLCEEAVAGQGLACTSARIYRGLGTLERPAFQTDNLSVSLVTVAPGGQFSGEPAESNRCYILLNPADAPAVTARRDDATPAAAPATRSSVTEWRGGTWRPPTGFRWRIGSRATHDVVMLEVVARK